MADKFPLINLMSPAQQKKAIAFLKAQLECDDQAYGDTGYNDHPDTTKLRVFLIEIGAVQDRRKVKKCK